MQGAEWKKVHAELTRLARAKAAHDADEACWLVEAKRVRVHEQLGFSTLLEYLERLFGYGPRTAKERLRVAQALAELPALRSALAAGALPWSAVRELTRVAVAATETDWLAAAAGKTLRQIEEMVSGRTSGDRPDDPARPEASRHVLRLELSAESLAAFREARSRIELDVGHALDDDAAIRMLAHYALGGPAEPGRAPYQVAMTVCQECGRGTRDGAGRALAVAPHQVEAALCDAQEIDLAHVGQARPASQTIPPRIRRLVWRRDHGRCQAPGCRSAKFMEVHHVVFRSRGGQHDPSQMTVLCSAHHDQVHRGRLLVEGTAPDGLVFRHADGRPYGAGAEPNAAAESDAVDALRRTGVAARDARRAVAAALASGATRLEDLLPEALRVLRRTTYASCASEPASRYRDRRSQNVGGGMCQPVMASAVPLGQLKMLSLHV